MVREAKFRMSLIKSGQFFAESSVSESKYTFTLVYLSLPTTNCWRYFEIPGCRTLPWKSELTPIWSGEQRRRGKCLLGEEEVGGGDKRQGLQGVVASRSSDTRPSCDVPYCSSVSVFKLIKTVKAELWQKCCQMKIPILPYISYPTHVSSLPEWG